MNKAILIGNLTKDVESGETNSNIKFCRFTLAIQRKFKNEKREYEADFLNCIAWRGTAEFISKYFKKGSKICVVGSIQTRNYEGQDGQKKYVTEIVVEEAEFAGANTQKEETTATGANKGEKKAQKEEEDQDDLPF